MFKRYLVSCKQYYFIALIGLLMCIVGLKTYTHSNRLP